MTAASGSVAAPPAARRRRLLHAALRRVAATRASPPAGADDALVECGPVIEALAGLADGDSALDASQEHHLTRCLRCRAVKSRYRQMTETMRSLRQGRSGCDDRLESQILSHLDRHGTRPTRRAPSRPWSAPKGAAVGAAVAVGLLAITRRLRRAVGVVIGASAW